MKSKRGKYKTKQRDLILTFLIESAGNHITAEAIYEALNGKASQATIYRNLEELVREGAVFKYEAPVHSAAAGACYRYIGNQSAGDDFYHFLCTDCGQMLHLNCGILDNFSSHAEKDHGISINKIKTVLYGSCSECDANGAKRITNDKKGDCEKCACGRK